MECDCERRKMAGIIRCTEYMYILRTCTCRSCTEDTVGTCTYLQATEDKSRIMLISIP